MIGTGYWHYFNAKILTSANKAYFTKITPYIFIPMEYIIIYIISMSFNINNIYLKELYSKLQI